MFSALRTVHTLAEFREPVEWPLHRRLWEHWLKKPFEILVDAWDDTVGLLQWKKAKVEQLLYAVKLAVAMTSTAAVLFIVESPDPIGGVIVIAFVAGTDAAMTVRTSLNQLMGTVFGNVLGFLLASISDRIESLVACLGGIALLTGFFRSSRMYGLGAFFAQFAAFGAISQSAANARIAIQQNVAAIVWYAFITSAVFPTRPSSLLRDEMANGFSAIKTAVSNLEHVAASLTGNAHKRAEAMDEALDSTLTLEASVGLQHVYLDGTDVEPSLSPMPYPTHLVRTVVEQQKRVFSLLLPLQAAWRTVANAKDASNDPVFTAILPHLSALNQEVDVLMGLLILTLGRDVASLMRLLVKSCLELERISAAISKAQNAATVAMFQSAMGGVGSPQAAVAAMLDTVGFDDATPTKSPHAMIGTGMYTIPSPSAAAPSPGQGLMSNPTHAVAPPPAAVGGGADDSARKGDGKKCKHCGERVAKADLSEHRKLCKRRRASATGDTSTTVPEDDALAAPGEATVSVPADVEGGGNGSTSDNHAAVGGGARSSRRASVSSGIVRNDRSHGGGPASDEEQAMVVPAILTVVYCCTALTHELFQLYLAVSAARHAIEAL